MTLSIALITADPPDRIGSVLEPLRPYADEIVIAADSRVDDRTLEGYAHLADRLFRIEFRMIERHLAWLFGQCQGDWILRLDGDEAPSAAFVRKLPELIRSRRVQQFWTRLAWLYPDEEHVLDEPPWSEDFTARLVRNDGTLRVRGLQHLHMEAVMPRDYLIEPFYHLDLLFAGEEQRRDKAVRYEVHRPRLVAAGGGRINEAFYLPELRSSLELRPVPGEDRSLIARAMQAGTASSAGEVSAEHAPVVTLAEMDRSWEGRAVGAGTYRAELEPLQTTARMQPSEQRQLFIHVRNQGSDLWPAGLEGQPPIRLGHRWLHLDRTLHDSETPRSPFPRPVPSGSQILAPVSVVAPVNAGSYLLEVDVVHEHVRWFDCCCLVEVRVEGRSPLPPVSGRLRETSAPALRRWRAVRIPRTIHRVWLGSGEMPDAQREFAQTFATHHPGWEMQLWTDADLGALEIGDAERALARSHSELSNLVRYEILQRFGGVYVDTDVECRRALTPLLRGIDAFAALEVPGRVGTAVLGSVPGHTVVARAARLTRTTLGLGVHGADANGPYLLSLIIEQESGFAIFPAKLFYPYGWEEPERRHETFPDAYTVHHWALSWLASDGRSGH